MVNHNQRLIWPLNAKSPLENKSLNVINRVMTETTSTINITGFLTMTRGSSLRTESFNACITSFDCQILSFFSFISTHLKCLANLNKQVLKKWPQCESWEEGQR